MIIPTVKRILRMHGFPPVTPGLRVIRANVS